MAQQNTNGKRKSTIKKVWHYLKNYRFLLILSILMAALTVAGTLYVPILVGDAIDFIIKKGQVKVSVCKEKEMWFQILYGVLLNAVVHSL